MRPDPDCRLCGLWESRTNVVLPSGNLDSRVALVGEAPGTTEDGQGMPFVGRSGKVLMRILAEAGVSRDDVLITNTVKCRPPGNRDPKPSEMSACRAFLECELSSCEVIIGLGRSACRDLLGYSVNISEIANRDMRISVGGREVTFIPTFHPAACTYGKAALDCLRITAERIARELRR
ncbi:MAG: uracil-DNA glycosylase [Candidatus Methanomethylophilaceae archaeon]|nr:uracil-DNA glycosylase [Candidatus Methanomethylophilaceae archaeon]